MRFYFLFSALIFFISSSAQADILFFGFNPAPGEVRAAQEAADRRGEKLWVLPEFSVKESQLLKNLESEEARLIKQAERSVSDLEMDKIVARTLEIFKEKEALLERVSLTPETLIKKFEDYQGQGIELTSIILSGHDGNGKFWGTIGKEITSEQLGKAFKAAPQVVHRVESLLLLGCYTTNIGSLDTYWGDLLPSVKVFAGYDLKGPLASVPMGHEYLKTFLLREKDFSKAKNKDEMLKQFNSLPQIKNLAAAIASRDFYVNNKGARSMADLYEGCKNLSANSELRKKFTCHYEALGGCEDVPHTQSGVLRKFYEDLQMNVHCKEMLTVDADHSLPAPEAVLSLIFFKNVRGNFARLHKAELIELDGWLRELQISPLLLQDNSKNRAELLQRIRATRAELLRRESQKLSPKEEFLARRKASRRLEEIDKVLLTLVPSCVPSAWVDPLVTIRSACVTKTATLESVVERDWRKLSSQEEK